MQGTWLIVGVYVLAGVAFVGLRWGRISAAGRRLVGNRVNVVFPFLVLIWPFMFAAWMWDEIGVVRCMIKANRMGRRCGCGEPVRVSFGLMRRLRDEGQIEAKCPRCGGQVNLRGKEEGA